MLPHSTFQELATERRNTNGRGNTRINAALLAHRRQTDVQRCCIYNVRHRGAKQLPSCRAPFFVRSGTHTHTHAQQHNTHKHKLHNCTTLSGCAPLCFCYWFFVSIISFFVGVPLDFTTRCVPSVTPKHLEPEYRGSVQTQNWIVPLSPASASAAAARAAHRPTFGALSSEQFTPGIPRHHAVATLCRCSRPFHLLSIPQLPPAQGVARHCAVVFFFFIGGQKELCPTQSPPPQPNNAVKCRSLKALSRHRRLRHGYAQGVRCAHNVLRAEREPRGQTRCCCAWRPRGRHFPRSPLFF